MAWTSADMAEMRGKLNERSIEIGRLNAKIESDAKVIAALRKALQAAYYDTYAEDVSGSPIADMMRAALDINEQTAGENK